MPGPLQLATRMGSGLTRHAAPMVDKLAELAAGRGVPLLHHNEPAARSAPHSAQPWKRLATKERCTLCTMKASDGQVPEEYSACMPWPLPKHSSVPTHYCSFQRCDTRRHSHSHTPCAPHRQTPAPTRNTSNHQHARPHWPAAQADQPTQAHNHSTAQPSPVR